MQNKIKIEEERRDKKETKLGPPKGSKTSKSRACLFCFPFVSLYRTWIGLLFVAKISQISFKIKIKINI